MGVFSPQSEGEKRRARGERGQWGQWGGVHRMCEGAGGAASRWSRGDARGATAGRDVPGWVLAAAPPAELTSLEDVIAALQAASGVELLRQA